MRILPEENMSWQRPIISISNNGTATKGNRYIVGESPTGAFSGLTPDDIAWYDGTEWQTDTPEEGWIVYDLNQGTLLVYMNGPSDFYWYYFSDIFGSAGGGGSDNQNASEVPTDTTNFNNNLSSADDTVQKALETLDDHYDPDLPYKKSNLKNWIGPDSLVIHNTNRIVSSFQNKAFYKVTYGSGSGNVDVIGSLNSFPAINFNSTSKYISGSYPYWGYGSTGNYTWIGVFSFTGTSGCLENQYNGASNNMLVLMDTASATHLRLYLRDDSGTSLTFNIPLTEFASICIMAWRYDNTSKVADLWVNGNHYTGTNGSLNMATNATDVGSIKTAGLGGNIGPSGFSAGTGMTGVFLERIVFVDAKSDADINELANNFGLKYSLTWTDI